MVAQDASTHLSHSELAALLEEMERNMRKTERSDGESDQWRLYKRIVLQLEHGPYLRLGVQASAGTGKSYLLKAVCLWCILHGIRFEAGAPTGIAAANLEVEDSGVAASTIHNLFQFKFDDAGKNASTLDWRKLDKHAEALVRMQLLLFDESSMIDDEFWSDIAEQLVNAQCWRDDGKWAAPDKLGQAEGNCNHVNV